MESIQCIFCNIGSDKIVIEENGYKGRKCPQCGLIYVSPRPTFSQTVNLYTDDKASIYAQSIIPNDYAKRLHAKHTLNIMKKYKNGGKLLEIGAGAGYFLDEARKEGFEVFGNELNKIQANFMESILGIPCDDSVSDESSFNGRKFDLIYHCNVLSHFYDPIAEFKKIHGRLSENGILIFETGNLGDTNKKHFKVIPKFYCPDHLFFFSNKSMIKLTKLTGFEIIGMYRYSITLNYLENKLICAIKHILKNKETRENEGKCNITETSFQKNDTKFSLKQLLKKFKLYLSFFLLYKIGRIIPKKGRPQTVIVIARKIN